MSAQSRKLVITAGSSTDIRGETVTTFEKLQRKGAPSAFHNSSARFNPPKCHPNTRVAILEYLMGWIFGRNDPEALILWLYGPAGAGKSAILQTIAERCFERKVLLASFFFARSDPSRNHFKPFVATIAYQIAVTIPELKPHIESVVEHDPAIFTKSIATQVQSLIIEPLTYLCTSGFFNNLRTCARLILIDALDECDDPDVRSEILKAIAGALRGQKIPLIFLISSRPEQSITHTFDSSSLSGLWRSLVLDNSFEPDEDILLFLNDSFQEIKASHPLRRHIPASWPVQSDIDKLIEKSSGQFIYASVVVKYVSAHNDRPSQRLEVIMGLRPARSELPFVELDAVYNHILTSCEDQERVHLILELLICGINDICAIEVLLDLEPGDVEIALAHLHSILTFQPAGLDTAIYFSHASFGDFLVDSSRSTRFYVNKLTVREHTLSTSIRKLMNPPLFVSNTTLPQYPPPLQAHLLIFLWNSLKSCFDGLPLTETVENALKEFSLEDMWKAWSPESDFGRKFPWSHHSRLYIVYNFLGSLKSLAHIGIYADPESRLQPAEDFNNVLVPLASCVTKPEPVRFAEIYAFHISSFENVFKSELTKYYCNGELTSLVVLLMTSLFRQNQEDNIIFLHTCYSSKTIEELMQINNESSVFDYNTLNLISHSTTEFMPVYYHYLFTGPNSSAGVGLDGDKYAATALRILNFLCAHPPRPLPYRIRPTSSHRVVSIQSAPFLSSRTATNDSERRSHYRFLRKQRVEKYRCGVVLSLPQTEPREEHNLKIIPIEVGLNVLSEILESSSKSPELVNFIRMHGKDIPFLPNLTRKVICAMHEYLNRPDEDVDME